MDTKKAAKIIDYVVTFTMPRWKEWINRSYENLDDIFISDGYEQGGLEAPAFYRLLKKRKIRVL